MNVPRRRRLSVSRNYPNTGAVFDGGSNQFLTIADNAALSMGAGVRPSGCFWIYPESLATLQFPFGKTTGGVAATSEYWVRVNNSTSKLEFLVSTGAANQTASSSTTIAVNTWYFASWYYDGATIGIALNNGSFATAVLATDITNGTQAFRLGTSAAGAQPFTGHLDCVGIWKRVLTAAEFTTLYNGGLGMAYQDLPTSLKDGVAWWDLDDPGGSSATWVDKAGANHLTAGAGAAAPTSGAGKR